MQHRTSTTKLTLVFSVTFALGLLLLATGVYLVIFMRYHERAYTPMVIGGACFIGSLAGLIMPSEKVKAAFFYGIMALGILGLLIGANYLTYRFYHERAYIVLAISVLCLLGGIVGAITIFPHARLRACLSVFTLGILASIGIVALIVGIDRLFVQGYQQNPYTLLAAGIVCLLLGIVGAVGTQSRAYPIILEKKREL